MNRKKSWKFGLALLALTGMLVPAPLLHAAGEMPVSPILGNDVALAADGALRGQPRLRPRTGPGGRVRDRLPRRPRGRLDSDRAGGVFRGPRPAGRRVEHFSRRGDRRVPRLIGAAAPKRQGSSPAGCRPVANARPRRPQGPVDQSMGDRRHCCGGDRDSRRDPQLQQTSRRSGQPLAADGRSRARLQMVGKE